MNVQAIHTRIVKSYSPGHRAFRGRRGGHAPESTLGAETLMRHGSLGNGGERMTAQNAERCCPRKPLLRLVRDAPERDRPPPAPGGTGLSRALVVGTTVLDRARKNSSRRSTKAVETLLGRRAVGKATNDVVVRSHPRPRPPSGGQEVADKTVAVVKPRFTKATEKTGQTVHKIREKVRSR